MSNRTFSQTTVDRQLRDLKEYSQRFFGALPYRVNETDREDILGIALGRLQANPYNDEYAGIGETPAKIETHFFNLLRYSAGTWFGIQRYREEVRSEIASIESRVCRLAGDGENATTLRDLAMAYGTPPYRVVFSDRNQLWLYRENPMHIPYFNVVPAAENKVARTPRSAHVRRTSYFGENKISIYVAEELNEKRSQFSSAIRYMMPDYLQRAGWEALPRELRAIVRIVRRTETLATVRSELGLAPSTYHHRIEQLKKRGWHFRKRELDGGIAVVYNPIEDRRSFWFRTDALKKLLQLDISEIMDALQMDDPQCLTRPFSDEESYSDIARVCESFIESYEELTSEKAHDDRLRAFITDLVERPTYCKGMSLREIDAILKRIPIRRQKDLLFRAIKYKSTVAEVLSFGELWDGVYEKDSSLDLNLLARMA